MNLVDLSTCVDRHPNEIVDRQRCLAAIISKTFCLGLPLTPAGPPGSFDSERAYRADLVLGQGGEIDAGLATALLRIEDLDDHAWLLLAPGGAPAGFVVEAGRFQWRELRNDRTISLPEILAVGKLDSIGLRSHILSRSSSTWSFGDCGVAAVLIADGDLFGRWTRARVNDLAKMREQTRKSAMKDV